MTSEAIMRPDVEATTASKAIEMAATGNMHMDTMVFEVTEFIFEVK